MVRDCIEMRRLSDGAVYRFLRVEADGAPVWRRADKDIVIIRDARFGWVVWDREAEALMGRPWDVPQAEQGEAPPQGDWVSRRGANSFVYTLVYV
jgi:hypothetical protein